MYRNVRRSLAAAGLVGLLASALQAETAVALRDCHVKGSPDVARCGSFQVAENPARPAGRQLELPIIVLPASGGDPQPDPLFILAGGPGQAASELVGYAELALRRTRRQRDLVFVDLRGTGGDSRLTCDLGKTEDLFAHAELLGISEQQVKACRDRLAQHADLAHYSTYQAVRDLDLVRAALGYERINLWGGSYGTRAGMVYQQLFPERTRTVILDGLAPYEVLLPQHNAREAQRALDFTFQACAADAACRQLLPDPAGALARIQTALEKAPARARIVHPRLGTPLDVVVTPSLLAGTLRVLLYSADSAGAIPFLLRRVEEGDWAPLMTAALEVGESSGRTMAIGFTLAVLCNEDVARIDPAEATRLAAGTMVGSTELNGWTSSCSEWPRTELPENFFQLSPSNVPALLLSGELDPIVPPYWGEKAAALFPRGRHVVVPGTAHNTSHVGCVPKLIASFLERGNTEGLDIACAGQVARPPLATSFAGREP
jgi:pimeloyl-ACP methyl ester carboxylesterase